MKKDPADIVWEDVDAQTGQKLVPETELKKQQKKYVELQRMYDRGRDSEDKAYQRVRELTRENQEMKDGILSWRDEANNMLLALTNSQQDLERAQHAGPVPPDR